MDARTRKTLFMAGNIITLISGIICCITIFGAIIGIPCIICYNTLKKVYDGTDQDCAQRLDNREGFGWSIFSLIVCFPLGLLTFLPYVIGDNSNNGNNNDQNNN